MRKLALVILFPFLSTSVATVPQGRDLVGTRFSARIVKVVDGDTVDAVVNGSRAVRIRLEGIDAPARGEAFSSRALVFMRVMFFDKDVTVDGKTVDRYGRLVARIFVGPDDASVGIAEAGLACHYKQYSADRQLAAAESRARAAGRGFWAASAQKPRCVNRTFPVAPAVFASALEGPFRGNTSSRVFHSQACSNFNCKNCTQVFRTHADARSAGFRPAGDCLRRSRR